MNHCVCIMVFLCTSLFVYMFTPNKEQPPHAIEPKPELEPEDWALYEEKGFSRKTTNAKQDVNLKKLSELIFRAIKVYGLEMTGIAMLAKELTLDVGYSMTDNNDTRRLFRQEQLADGRKCFLVFKMSKDQKNISTKVGEYCKCYATRFIFLVEYTLLIPNNASAERRCNEFMNDKIGIKLDGNLRRTSSGLY